MALGYDYVVVGGGSAGCVLAARLSENPDVTVCLLEAGGRDTNPFIHMPVGFAKMTTGPLTWGLKTAPQKHANNREIPYAQARVLGGGSSINAEIFTRGTPSDFDAWDKGGAKGWSFKEVRKYFLKSEGNAVLSGEWHGVDGPLSVSNIPDPQPLTRAFVKSCQELGMPFNADFNGGQQEGAGFYQTTTRNNRRCSAAVGYLRPALKRRNLTVVTGASVLRVLVSNDRARGVAYRLGNEILVAEAGREVVVTSGAIGSPKLLMLSGIGPSKHLKALGIEVLHDLPGVGQNLTDHFGIDIVAELKAHTSLDKYNKWHWMLWAGLQYAIFNSGPVTSNVVEGAAFWFSNRTKKNSPDLQFHFLAGAGAEAGVPSVTAGRSGITLNSYTLRPKSRGSVTLRSSDPNDKPVVDPNFLAEPEDLRIAVEGVKISRYIFTQPSLQKYVSTIRFPNAEVKSQSDFENYARSYGRTSYHPVGTCRMGDDDLAVLDPQLRVRGIDRLRVCDSSAMPTLIGSNTNAATIMIGEKASDMIRGNH